MATAPTAAVFFLLTAAAVLPSLQIDESTVLRNPGGQIARLPFLHKLLRVAQLDVTPHEAPSWFKLIPLPSIKGKYFIPGPFQSPNAETPFTRRVAQASTNVQRGWEPVAKRFFEHYIYPLANATIHVNQNKTEAIQASHHCMAKVTVPLQNIYTGLNKDHASQPVRQLLLSGEQFSVV